VFTVEKNIKRAGPEMRGVGTVPPKTTNVAGFYLLLLQWNNTM